MILDILKREVEKITKSPIQRFSMLGGGSINSVAKITCGTKSYVLKWNKATLLPMFEAEEKGLKLLQEHSDELIVPKIYGIGSVDTFSWLLMEHIPETSHTNASFFAFGEALAQMHASVSDRYGLDSDNYIGSLPQENTMQEKWLDFFRFQRIEPQLRMAVNSGKMSAAIFPKVERLYTELESIFPNEPASLLHGDLWSGNMLATEGGKTALIDPAVYYGHREMELSFTRLFGGFSSSFYDGYFQTWPLEPGFDDRVDFYNLYPLLVHVNLFGGGYIRQVEQIINPF